MVNKTAAPPLWLCKLYGFSAIAKVIAHRLCVNCTTTRVALYIRVAGAQLTRPHYTDRQTHTMLLDQYLLPLTELAISVALPLVLTLKALQLATLPSTPPQTAHRVLAFWLTYWLIVSLAQLAGINGHVRCFIAVLYYSKSHEAQIYLLNLYQNTLLPFASSMLFRAAHIQLSTEEVDNAIEYAVQRMCFDANYFTDNLLEMTIPKAITPTKLSFWPLGKNKTTSSSKDITSPILPEPVVSLESIIPLEMTRVRSPYPVPPYPKHTAPSQLLSQDKSRPCRRSLSLQGLSKKSSRHDLRSSSWNTGVEDVTADKDLSAATPPRVPSSSDLVFEESPSDHRTSIRGSLKGLFT